MPAWTSVPAHEEPRAVGANEVDGRAGTPTTGQLVGGVGRSPDPRAWMEPLAHRTARSLHHAALLHCQRTHGNAFVQRLLRSEGAAPRAASMAAVAGGAHAAAADPGVETV